MAVIAHHLDPLTAFGDGVRACAGGRTWPLPLASTDIAVTEAGGLATIRTTRVFRNAEAGPIEVTMTFPVPGDAILTGLTATIDGRDLVALAQEAGAARETYEAAIDTGRTAILHEEKLRGIHMLSLGNLPPGKEARVTVRFVAPLSFAGAVPALRVPVTVGEVYGRSPLLPCDDLVAGAVRLEASVAIVSATAVPQVLGLGAASGTLTLDRAIEIAFPGWRPSPAHGRAADGRAVTVTLEPLGLGELPLDVSVLFDRSGSTQATIGGDEAGRTVWEAMREGLRTALAETLRAEDRVRLVEFDGTFQDLGQARGPGAADLVERIGPPRGGTEIGLPLIATAKAHPGDVLLITDGKSHALDVQAIAALGRRVHVVLVGSDALDAAIGHLAALTGGMSFVALGADVAGAVRAALGALRIASGAPQARDLGALPDAASLLRGGARLSLAWHADGAEGEADDVGRFAAGLVLPALTREAAAATALAHGLCTHLTSLVVVDAAGEAQAGLPATRKVPLMRSAADASMPAAPLLVRRRSMATRPSEASRAAAPPHTAFAAHPAQEAPPSSAPASQPADAASGRIGRALASLRLGWSRRTPSPAPGAPRPEAAPARPLDLETIARQVDWDDLAARIDAQGIAAFPPDIRDVLDRVARLPAVADLARALGCTTQALAIALLARAAGAGSRSAARIARRALKGGEDERPALRAVGLAA